MKKSEAKERGKLKRKMDSIGKGRKKTRERNWSKAKEKAGKRRKERK